MGIVFKTKTTQKQLIGKSTGRRQKHAAETVLAATLSSPAIVNDLVPNLKIVRMAIAELRPAKRRIRKHPDAQVNAVAKSVSVLGQVAPILIDRDDRVVDGHIVLAALKKLGETHVNCVCLDHLNEDQLKLVQVALHKTSEGSTWELEELRPVLQELELVGYDLTVTGFTLPEVDIILQPVVADEDANEPEAAIEPPEAPISRLGDRWCLGDHRVLCGDALKQESYEIVLGGEGAAACFTDCPWNIPIEGFVSGLGATKHKDFKMAAGEMSEEAFQDFLDTFTGHIAKNLEPGAVLYSCIDWRSMDRVIAAGRSAGLSFINMAVWNKGSGGMGSLYRSAYELIPIFCKGKSPKTNNVQLGKHGRDRTNVFSYPGANRRGSSANQALKDHPTPKPVEMVEDAILDVTNRGETVLDPFLGSGTTLLAAERSGRVAAGIELDPAFVDVCIRRWEELTGESAVHVETGLTFTDMAARRAGEEPIEGGE